MSTREINKIPTRVDRWPNQDSNPGPSAVQASNHSATETDFLGDPVSEMTYTVSSGTLNSTISYI